MKSFLLLILFLEAAGSCGGGEQPKIAMLRTQAGAPDSSGWISAESTNGHFSVQVPIPFNEMTSKDSGPLIAKTEGIGCKSAEGIKFSATKVTYKAAGSAKKLFANFRTAWPSATVNEIVFGGHPALDVTNSDALAQSKYRVVLVNEELYILIVEWPIQQEALAGPLTEPFLASLKFLP